MESLRRFDGKTFVVTGAAQGIGKAVARLLAEEGAFVYALDVQADRLQASVREINRHCIAAKGVVADIASRERMDSVIGQIDRERAIDGLVNAAAILIPAPFAEINSSDWLDTFDINVHGTFFISNCVARRMILRGSGAIVTVASNAATTPRINFSAYCVSKAAVAMLTKCMALELAGHGIRCNVISPGSTNTDMLRVAAGDQQPDQEQIIAGDLAAFKNGIPLRKIAEPEDIAKAVSFLLSDDANHITMQNLIVDGGATF